ncbi:armadillo repeat-containing protein 1-like [Ranitomeya imitator]|uniref:armadillo repeat-containing protein 1-like n=1 Tax=Ranitomeya imitator TaxID=111125 RepID=UPI0037E754BE
MDAVAVVAHLRDLASDPQNRASIVRDRSCLAGLILFLGHQDPQVAEVALEAIHYLCENPNHCKKLRSELGMMVSLENIKNSDTRSNRSKLLAHRIHMSLSVPGHLHTPEAKNKPNNLQFFIASANKRAKTITLHIHGLDDLERKCLCEEVLLKVKGVISFTFQIAIRRCTVRVKPDLATECLTSAIAETKVLKAQQVIRNDCGEEVYVPLLSTNSPVEKSQCLPDYLPEEESPQKDLEKALVHPAAKDETHGSWVNAAASFLSKTFYW